MNNKQRIIYTILTLALLAAEICIALFVRDQFIRPYGGDILVTLLIGSFFRIFMPQKPRLLPIYVFLFAAAVEVGQYVNVLELLGLENNRLLSVIIGRTFSPEDLVCYAAGCLILFAVDTMVCRHHKSET